LLGFNLQVEFKPGATNVMADALSHCDTKAASVMVISCPSFQLFDDLWQEIDNDLDFHTLRDEAATGARGKH
jgi:hypothetical protein